jgi:hypothetical protein
LRDVVIAHTLAQAGENAPPPQNHGRRADPPTPGRRHLPNHLNSLSAPASGRVAQLFLELGAVIPRIWKIWNRKLRLRLRLLTTSY